MKITYNKFNLTGFIYIFIISFFTVIAYWIFETPNIFFISNLLMIIFIVAKAKISYFSIKTLIMNYILFAVFFQYNTGESYGILEISSIKLHYFEANLLIYIYNAMNYIWISSTRILENEIELLKSKFTLGKIATYFCCILAIATAIIAFPGMPFSQAYLSNRFVGLLQGNAWNHISIVCLLFIMPNFKKDNIVKITYIFTIFWFVSHYERVDIVGLLLFYVVYIVVTKYKIKLTTYLKGRSYINSCIIINGLFRGSKSRK